VLTFTSELERIWARPKNWFTVYWLLVGSLSRLLCCAPSHKSARVTRHDTSPSSSSSCLCKVCAVYSCGSVHQCSYRQSYKFTSGVTGRSWCVWMIDLAKTLLTTLAGVCRRGLPAFWYSFTSSSCRQFSVFNSLNVNFLILLVHLSFLLRL